MKSHPLLSPTVHKHKDIRGRKITGFTAHLGPVETFDRQALPESAIEQCANEVRNALTRLHQGLTIECYKDQTYVIFPTIAGWGAWCSLYSRFDYWTEQSGTRTQAERSIKMHIAAQMWNHEVADDRAFVADLHIDDQAEMIGRLTWYRGMRRLMDLGVSDSDARAVLSGFKREAEVLSCVQS